MPSQAAQRRTARPVASHRTATAGPALGPGRRLTSCRRSGLGRRGGPDETAAWTAPVVGNTAMFTGSGYLDSLSAFDAEIAFGSLMAGRGEQPSPDPR